MNDSSSDNNQEEKNQCEGNRRRVDFQSNKCMVKADPDRINQVIINLLDNAISLIVIEQNFNKNMEEQGKGLREFRIRVLVYLKKKLLTYGIGLSGRKISEWT